MTADAGEPPFDGHSLQVGSSARGLAKALGAERRAARRPDGGVPLSDITATRLPLPPERQTKSSDELAPSYADALAVERLNSRVQALERQLDLLRSEFLVLKETYDTGITSGRPRPRPMNAAAVQELIEGGEPGGDR